MYEIYFKCDFCGDTLSRDICSFWHDYFRKSENQKPYAYVTFDTFGNFYDSDEKKEDLKMVLCKECYKKIMKLKMVHE